MAAPKNWSVVWKTHQENRKWVKRVVSADINACAITLSATLMLKPTGKDYSLTALPAAKIQKAYRGQAMLKDYYVRAQQLADRLEREWGAPTIRAARETAAKQVKGRYGVIFFENPYAGGVDHLDLFNGKEISSRLSVDGAPLLSGNADPFKLAQRIWFWEFYNK